MVGVTSYEVERNRFFFQAEDGIRDLVRSRGLGDVYKRQEIRRSTHSSVSYPGGGVAFVSVAVSAVPAIAQLDLSLIHI